jgi:hypothetical protein
MPTELSPGTPTRSLQSWSPLCVVLHPARALRLERSGVRTQARGGVVLLGVTAGCRLRVLFCRSTMTGCCQPEPASDNLSLRVTA